MRQNVWHCSRKYYKDRSCDSPVIREEEIKEKFVSAFNEIYDEREFILDCCRDLLAQFEDTVPLDERIEECIRECEIVEEMNRKLLEENSRIVMDQEAFLKKHNGYVERYEEAAAEAERLQKLKDNQLKKADKISEFMFEIYERDGILEDFDEKLWIATIE